MLPSTSSYNGSNTRQANAKLVREWGMQFAIVGTLANYLYVTFSKACVPMLLAARVVASAFLKFVVVIVFACAKKQMGRIDAWRIVTMMTDEHAFWNGAKVQYVTEAMRPVIVKLAMLTLAAAAKPPPTFVRAAFVYLRPESLFDGRMHVMTSSVTKWLAFDLSASCLTSGCNGCRQATAAFAELWSIVRGMIGVHKNLHFLCRAGDCYKQSPGISMSFTRSIIPQEV